MDFDCFLRSDIENLVPGTDQLISSSLDFFLLVLLLWLFVLNADYFF